MLWPNQAPPFREHQWRELFPPARTSVSPVYSQSLPLRLSIPDLSAHDNNFHKQQAFHLVQALRYVQIPSQFVCLNLCQAELARLADFRKVTKLLLFCIKI